LLASFYLKVGPGVDREVYDDLSAAVAVHQIVSPNPNLRYALWDENAPPSMRFEPLHRRLVRIGRQCGCLRSLPAARSLVGPGRFVPAGESSIRCQKAIKGLVEGLQVVYQVVQVLVRQLPAGHNWVEGASGRIQPLSYGPLD
jgi:hypothetical protein